MRKTLIAALVFFSLSLPVAGQSGEPIGETYEHRIEALEKWLERHSEAIDRLIDRDVSLMESMIDSAERLFDSDAMLAESISESGRLLQRLNDKIALVTLQTIQVEGVLRELHGNVRIEEAIAAAEEANE